MNNSTMLEFLMTHDIDLVSNDTNRIMSADCLYELAGEFTVYERGATEEMWRGDDFETALSILEGNEFDAELYANHQYDDVDFGEEE